MTSAVGVDAPFPGLRPFTASESHLFFGRDEQVDALLARLAERRFLAVVGASGSGKSSLVRAGLLPIVEHGYLGPPGSTWRTAILSHPGVDPLRGLAEALAASFGLSESEHRTISTALLRNSRGLDEFSRSRLAPNERLLLLVDQFEELFRFRKQTGDRGRVESTAFTKLLLDSTGNSDVVPPVADGRVYVVLTMRSEYIGRCAQFHGLPEALNGAQYLVPRMSRDNLREAIEGPAAVFQMPISDLLVERLLNDSGENPDQLPVLQHALLRTWQQAGKTQAPLMDVCHYEAVGGIDNALNTDADEVFATLATPEKQAVARRLFQRLVEPGLEDKETRRPSRLLEIANVCGVPEDQVLQVIKPFRDRGFITLAGQYNLVDLSHESLIRQWKSLRVWVEEEALSAATYKRLADTAEHGWTLGGPELAMARAWRDREHPNEHWAARYPTTADYSRAMECLHASEVEDDRRIAWNKRRLYVLIGAALLFGCMSAATVYYFVNNKQNENINHARDLVTQSQNLLSAVPPKIDLSLLLALEAMRLSPSADAGAQVRAAVELLPTIPLARLDHESAVIAAAFGPKDRYAATLPEGRQVILWDLDSRRSIANYQHDNRINDFAFSMDREKIATADAGGAVRVWVTRTGARQAQFQHQDAVNGVAFHPNGRLLATASDDRTVRVWDIDSQREVERNRHGASVRLVAFNNAGNLVASAGDDGGVRIWTWPGLRQISEVESRDPVTALAFIPRDNECQDCLVTDSYDGILRVFGPSGRPTGRLREIRTGAPLFRINGYFPGAREGRLFPSILSGAGELNKVSPEIKKPSEIVFGGRELLVLHRGSTARFLWESFEGTEIFSLPQTGEITAAEIAHSEGLGNWPRDGLILTASLDHTARLWRVPRTKRFVQFLERWEQALSADGRHSAAVADDHIEIYNAPFTSAAATISMPPSTGVSIRSSDWHNLKLSADGELVAWAGAGSVAVVNARNGKPLATVQALEPMHSFAIARDALVIAAKGQIEIHDPANGNKLKSAPMEDVRDAVLSPDGRYAAIVDSAGQLFLWPVSGDSPPVKTGGLTGGSAVRNTDVVGHPRFSPEGNWLAACSSGHEMNIVRTDAPSEIRATDVDVACRSVSFDSAGGLLAVAGDGGVSVWSVGDWRKKGGVPIRGGVAGAVLSLDGALLATHGSGSSLVSPASPATKGSPSVLRVWRWRTGEELARVQVDDATGDDLAFAAGDQLFDRTFLLWKPADVMAEACRYLTRNLTPSEVADYLPWEMGPRPWQKGYRPVCSVRPEVIEKIEKPPQP